MKKMNPANSGGGMEPLATATIGIIIRAHTNTIYIGIHSCEKHSLNREFVSWNFRYIEMACLPGRPRLLQGINFPSYNDGI
jgi:hypothetical protein